MMDYREFVEEFVMAIEEETGLKAEFHEENEKMSKDSIYVYLSDNENSTNIMCVYTKESYGEWKNKNRTFCSLVKEVKQSVENFENMRVPDKMRQMEDYDRVKGSLFIRLINAEKNEDELKYAIYKQVGDIALTLYIMLAEEDGMITSCKVPLRYIDKWNMKKEKIFDVALRNTALMMPPRWYDFMKMLFIPEYDGEDIYDSDYAIQKETLGNCLSTNRKTNGAVAIFYPGVAKYICQEMKTEELYLVFTSTHEVMVHNVKKLEVEDLKRTLKDTMEEATPEDDVLTNYVYHYDLHTDQIEMVL